MVTLSRHAELRAQQRGKRAADFEAILEHGDIEKPIGDNCWEIGISRRAARGLRDLDKLSHFRVILSDTSGQIRTVFPLERRRYRPKYWRR